MKTALFNLIRKSFSRVHIGARGGLGSDFLVFSFIAAVTCAAIGFASPAQARKPLSYANHLPAIHPVNVALKTYFDGVTKASGGSLTFQMFPGGAMGGGKALLGDERGEEKIGQGAMQYLPQIATLPATVFPRRRLPP